MRDSLGSVMAVLSWGVSFALGWAAALFTRHRFASGIDASLRAGSGLSPGEILRFADALSQLSIQVDAQVGDHSRTVGEITSSLKERVEAPAAILLTAGDLLIKANKKLQTELAEAQAEIERQRKQVAHSLSESRTDALTGLHNRRAFDAEITQALIRQRHDRRPISVLVLDIDHFKRINDRYGHMVGDQILKSFARCLATSMGDKAFVSRFGGEEFVAFFPRTSLQEAVKIAHSARQNVQVNRFSSGECQINITTSVGVTQLEPGEDVAIALANADEALYAAKRAGRNRVFQHDGTNCAQADVESSAQDIPVTTGSSSLDCPTAE